MDDKNCATEPQTEREALQQWLALQMATRTLLAPAALQDGAAEMCAILRRRRQPGVPKLEAQANTKQRTEPPSGVQALVQQAQAFADPDVGFAELQAFKTNAVQRRLPRNYVEKVLDQ